MSLKTFCRKFVGLVASLLILCCLVVGLPAMMSKNNNNKNLLFENMTAGVVQHKKAKMCLFYFCSCNFSHMSMEISKLLKLHTVLSLCFGFKLCVNKTRQFSYRSQYIEILVLVLFIMNIM